MKTKINTKGKQILSTTKCPLCEKGNLKYHFAKVHYWICEDCPFIGFEFYTKKDITNLAKYL